MSKAAVQDAILPWVEGAERSEGDEAQEDAAVVSEEAHLILEIIRFSEVVTCSEELLRTFSHEPLEAHLAEALVAGGAMGELDMSRMFAALKAAAALGSSWAPLWLGDVECFAVDGCGEEENCDMAYSLEARRRSWYLQAAARGHPDAVHRLAALASGPLDGAVGDVGTEDMFRALGDFTAGLAGFRPGRSHVEELVSEEDDEDEEAEFEIDFEFEEEDEDKEDPRLASLSPQMRRMLTASRALSAQTDDNEVKDIFKMLKARPPKSRL